MNDLMTMLTVWRPSHQWTILFQHKPYASALWALLFDPDETLMASEYFGNEWQYIQNKHIADHVVGYRTTAGEARERLVKRLGPVRGFTEPWRAFSLTRALALSLAAVPPNWPLRLDASCISPKGAANPKGASKMTLGARYAELMAVAVNAAAELANNPPQHDISATRLLLAMTHGMNPETLLRSPSDGSATYLAWPKLGTVVEYELLGKPVECPSSYVESMTRARHQWQARW